MSQVVYTANFNSVSLGSIDGLTVLKTDPYKPSKRTVSNQLLARSDKSTITAGFYTERTLVVRVAISRSTRDLVEQSFDSLMSILQGFEKELVLRQAGAARKYICTYSDANILKDGGSYLELDLIFVTSDHFGYDTSYTILINDQQFTSSSRTDQISLAGSAPWQQPIIRYTYSALTGGTSKVVTISNDAVGQTLTITRTWAAGDVLTIDPSDTDPVKVNGVTRGLS